MARARRERGCFLFLGARGHRGLPSFPTRRSSDLITRSSAAIVDGPSTRPTVVADRRTTQELRNVSRMAPSTAATWNRSEEHTSELQSRLHLLCRLRPEKQNRRVLPRTTRDKPALR